MSTASPKPIKIHRIQKVFGSQLRKIQVTRRSTHLSRNEYYETTGPTRPGDSRPDKR